MRKLPRYAFSWCLGFAACGGSDGEGDGETPSFETSEALIDRVCRDQCAFNRRCEFLDPELELSDCIDTCVGNTEEEFAPDTATCGSEVRRYQSCLQNLDCDDGEGSEQCDTILFEDIYSACRLLIDLPDGSVTPIDLTSESSATVDSMTPRTLRVSAPVGATVRFETSAGEFCERVDTVVTVTTIDRELIAEFDDFGEGFCSAGSFEMPGPEVFVIVQEFSGLDGAFRIVLER